MAPYNSSYSSAADPCSCDSSASACPCSNGTDRAAKAVALTTGVLAMTLLAALVDSLLNS